MLQFIYLHTETNSGVFTGDDCTEDYVEVFDGAESIRRCGDWRGYEDNLQVHSVGDTLTVTFVTDGTGNAGDSGGFLANWFTVVNDTLYRLVVVVSSSSSSSSSSSNSGSSSSSSSSDIMSYALLLVVSRLPQPTSVPAL